MRVSRSMSCTPTTITRFAQTAVASLNALSWRAFRITTRPCTSVPCEPAMIATRNRHLHAIYVGHWAGNLGDSAVFDVLDRALPPEVHLTMEVESIGDWRRRPQTTFIQWRDERAIEQALRDCYAVRIPRTPPVAEL